MTTPRGAPELVDAQALPETTVNEQIRRTEAGAGRFTVADRVTAPPGTCADGACYIIIATATGAFASKEGQIAQAVGANAASGWLYRAPGTIDEGIVAYVQDEDTEYKWSGAAWAVYGGAGYAPGGTDVAVADGGTGASTASAARTNLGVVIGTDVKAQAPSVQSVTSSATVTPTFSDDLVKITAQAAGLTLANPSGTAVPGWGIAIRIKDNGTSRSISYGTQYRAIGVTLPTATVVSKTLYLGCIWNADDTKLDVVAVAQEA